MQSRCQLLRSLRLFAVAILVAVVTSCGSSQTSGASLSGVTQSPADTSSAISPSFPPKTLKSFLAFAATGDASQVTQVGSATDGLSTCPQPALYVTVSSGLSGRTLEADLSAFFVQKGLTNYQCGAVVFAYHSESDYQANRDEGFTAGRVVTTAYGSQLSLEVDTGGATSEQSEFDFNF